MSKSTPYTVSQSSPNTKSSRGLNQSIHSTQSNGNEPKCLECLTNSPELGEQQLLETASASKQHNLSKSTPTLVPFSEATGPISQFTGISEPTAPNQETTTSTGFHSPAQAHQMLELEQDLITQNQPYGEKDCGASALPNPGSLLWNSLKDLSIEDFEQSLDRYEWRAIALKIFSSYRQRKQERCTNETGFLSCPTLTSCSSKSSRSAGGTKCEKWWKDNGLVPAGSQLSAPAIALLMGYPEDWFQALSPSLIIPPVESAPGISQGELSHQPRLPWRYAVFCTLIAFWQHEISLLCDSLEGDNSNYSSCNESSNASVHLPGVREGVSEQGDSELEKDHQILQSEMLQSEQAQNQGRSSCDRNVRVGNDSGGNSQKSRSKYSRCKQSLQERGIQTSPKDDQPNQRRQERQLERRCGDEEGVHCSEVSGSSQGFRGWGLCTPAHPSDGEILGTIPELLRTRTSRQRGSASHQSQHAGQPDREPSVDESVTAQSATSAGSSSEALQESQEDGHGRDISVSKSCEFGNWNESWGSAGSNQEPASLQGNYLGVCELSRRRSHCPGSCTCPSCQQPLISLDHGCGICGWVSSPSVLRDSSRDHSTYPLELKQDTDCLESSTSTPSVNNYSPVLGETAHPLELKGLCEQLPPVLGETAYPLEPEERPASLEALAEATSSLINPALLPSLSLAERGNLPKIRGIYLVLKQTEVIYIGQASNIWQRWQSHHLISRLWLLPEIRIAWSEVEGTPLHLIERLLIKRFLPLLNNTFVTGDVPRESRAVQRASGWLERYTKTKKLKNGTIATYPACERERDPDNPDHWYWAYRYEEKRQDAKSDNGYITRAVSLPRVKVQAVRRAIARGLSVEKVLSFIQGEELK